MVKGLPELPAQWQDRLDVAKADPDALAAVRAVHRLYFNSREIGAPIPVRQNLFVEGMTFPRTRDIDNETERGIMGEEQHDFYRRRHEIEKATKRFTREQIVRAMEFWRTLPERLGVSDTRSDWEMLCNDLGVNPDDRDALWETAEAIIKGTNKEEEE